MQGETSLKILFLVCVLALLLVPVSALNSGDSGESTDLPPLSVEAPVNPAFLAAMEEQAGTALIVGTGSSTTDLIPSPVEIPPVPGEVLSAAIQAMIAQREGLSLGPGGYPPVVGADAAFDLRTKSRVSPVRDQGICSASWAFATYGSLESYLLPEETWDFSENNLKNLHGFDYNPCTKGTISMAAAYLTRWSGPVAEADDPYNQYSGSSPPDLEVRKQVREIFMLPPLKTISERNTLKDLIKGYGAVITTYRWDPAYYNQATKAYRYPNMLDPNQAIALVGWDDNFPRTSFSPAASLNGAFIAKSSWGKGFGNQGYFSISYDDRVLGNESALFMAPPRTYSRILQYDTLGWTKSRGYGSDTAYFANVFTGGVNEELSAVGFYTATVYSNYDIFVYQDPVSGPLNSKGWVLRRTGTLSLPGYYTVWFPTPLPLQEGKKFSVVVKLQTPGYDYPIPLEKPVPGYSMKATASPGQSYISADGSQWTDLTTQAPNSNVCLKAYTTALPNPVPYITSLKPMYVTAGSPGIVLTIYGVNFVQGSQARWNGEARSTTYVSPTTLKVQIPEVDLRTPGTARLTVDNPPPGGGTSNPSTFTIDHPVPSISRIIPDSVTAGDSGFSLTVTGTDFDSGSLVRWNGADRSTVYRSPTELIAQIPASDIRTAGTAGVSVFNPAPGGGETDILTFRINNPVPSLASIDPVSAKAGGDAFTLKVTGADFVPGSKVRWNGQDRGTVYRSAMELTTMIPAGDIATNATATITVFNPGPGGGISNGISFEILPALQKPVADFIADRTAGYTRFTVQFQDNSTGESIDNWSWTFGDSSTSTERNPVHTYQDPGDYDVTLTVTNPAGSSSVMKPGFISVRDPPTIRIEDHPSEITSGQEVTFTAVTNLPVGEPVIMDVISRPSPITDPLDMTGVQEFSGTAGVPSVTRSGDRNITTLTVKTGQLLTAESPYTYLVRAEAPVAGISAESQFLLNMSEPFALFGADTVAGTGPVTVRFIDTSENSPTAWLWDFGDGTTSTEQNPVHTYEPITPRSASDFVVGDGPESPVAYRNYTVTLTASNAMGTSTTVKEDQITIVSDSIPVSEDTSIDSPLLIDVDPNETPPVQSIGGENLGASAVLTVLQGQGAAGEFNGSRLALVRFDLPPVPSYLIEKATVHLYHTGGTGEDVAVHRMKTGWSETEATFSAPEADAPSWETGWASGENYEVQPTDVVQVSDPDRWYEWDVTQDVKAFLDGTSNYGWVVMAGDGSAGLDVEGTTFAAREAGNGVRGYLEIVMKETHNPGSGPLEDKDILSNNMPIVRFESSPHEGIILKAAQKMKFPAPSIASEVAMGPDSFQDDIHLPIPILEDAVRQLYHSATHYYNPDLSLGYAPSETLNWTISSRDAYQMEDYMASAIYLGYASHFMIDIGNPLHTGREIDSFENHFPHDTYERWVSDNWDDGSKYNNLTTNDPFFYRVSDPSRSTIHIAQYTHKYVDYTFGAFCSQVCDCGVDECHCLYNRPWEEWSRVNQTLQSVTAKNMLVLSRNVRGLVDFVMEGQGG